MTAALVLLWLKQNWRLVASGVAALAVALLVWEVRSTYAERDRLVDQVANLRVEAEMLRSNAATAAQLRLEVQACLDAVAAAQGAADSWVTRYAQLKATVRPRPEATPPAPLPGTTCEDAARQYAAWLLGEVSR